jgi:hypothetical protein
MLLLLWAGSADATEIGSRPFGLGLQLGEPFGITGKYYLGGRRNAIDFLVGGNYDDDNFDDDDLYAHVNYHWHLVELTSGGGVAIPFRLGVGGFVAFGDNRWVEGDEDFLIGARMPVGLDFDLESAPVQFYIEIGVQLVILPPVDFGADAGIGVRYYF